MPIAASAFSSVVVSSFSCLPLSFGPSFRPWRYVVVVVARLGRPYRYWPGLSPGSASTCCSAALVLHPRCRRGALCLLWSSRRLHPRFGSLASLQRSWGPVLRRVAVAVPAVGCCVEAVPLHTPPLCYGLLVSGITATRPPLRVTLLRFADFFAVGVEPWSEVLHCPGGVQFTQFSEVFS